MYVLLSNNYLFLFKKRRCVLIRLDLYLYADRLKRKEQIILQKMPECLPFCH